MESVRRVVVHRGFLKRVSYAARSGGRIAGGGGMHEQSLGVEEVHKVVFYRFLCSACSDVGLLRQGLS